MSTIVLLGAGASVEAGLPVTEALTPLIEQRVSEVASEPNVIRAFRYAMGGLSFRQGQRGLPVQRVNIEEVVSALDLLGNRASLEVGPFVGSWHHMVQELDPGGTGRPFLDAARAARWAMVDLLRVSEPAKVEYLSPILRLLETQDRFVVATLNYDNTMELLLEYSGFRWSTGIKAWAGNQPRLQFSGDVWLLKLHGSISWQFHHARLPDGNRSTASWVSERPFDAPRSSYNDPCLLLGSRAKLQSEGPFLELLQMFTTELHAATHLVVVGYSCQDEHINTILLRWRNSTTPETPRRLTFIDPAFGHIGEQSSFSHRATVISTKAGVGLQSVFAAEAGTHAG